MLLSLRTFGSLGKGSKIDYPVNNISGSNNIYIGKNVYIGKYAHIMTFDMYLKRKYAPKLIIEDNVSINYNFHCTCASTVRIGEGTSITGNCGVFDIIHPYEDIYHNPRLVEIETKAVDIGKNCLIGMNSVILPGTKIGDHCVVGANSVLNKEYPAYSVIVGSPGKIIKRYDFETCTWRKTDNKGLFL